PSEGRPSPAVQPSMSNPDPGSPSQPGRPSWVISGHGYRNSECPLYPQKQTSPSVVCMSAKCHEPTHAPPQTTCCNDLFDHLIGAGEHGWRNIQAEHLGGPEIDDQPEFGRLLDGKLRRFSAL